MNMESGSRNVIGTALRMLHGLGYRVRRSGGVFLPGMTLKIKYD